MLRRYGIPITGRDMGELHKHGDGGKGDKINRGQYGWFALSVPQARAGWAGQAQKTKGAASITLLDRVPQGSLLDFGFRRSILTP